MSAAVQWVSTTPGRLAGDAYSWMQCVHWVHERSGYTPARAHGPRFGPTTVLIAQKLATLKECRPSVDWLMRVLKLSERTVQYHLEMLRESGLLAYVSLPVWVKGEKRPRQAAVFARVIPAGFDRAHGIRTVLEEDRPAVERRPVGVAENARKAIGQLAAKAARRVRRPRRAGGGRCTPVSVAQLGTSRTVSPTSPSEAKRRGKAPAPTSKSSRSRPAARRVNAVGRCYQLAAELVRRVLWLGHVRGEGKARLAWVVRDVAAAGWTADEVMAWLDLSPPPQRVHRPSGLLAARLRGATAIWSTAAARDAGRVAAAESRRAERNRHDDAEHDGLNAPMSRAVAARAWAGLRDGVARYRARQAALGLDDLMPATAADAGPVGVDGATASDSEAEAAAVLAAFLNSPIMTGVPA